MQKETFTEWMDNVMEQYEKQCMYVLFNKADTRYEEFLLLNYPKISPVRLYYFLYNNSTVRTIKVLYVLFWNFCPCILTLVSGTSVGVFFVVLNASSLHTDSSPALPI